MAADSVVGLRRASTMRWSGEPSLRRSPRGLSAQTITARPSNGTSSGVSGMSEVSPSRTSKSPGAGGASRGSWPVARIGVIQASTRPAAPRSHVRLCESIPYGFFPRFGAADFAAPPPRAGPRRLEAGALPARAFSSSTACSMVTASGAVPLGSDALVSPSVT